MDDPFEREDREEDAVHLDPNRACGLMRELSQTAQREHDVETISERIAADRRTPSSSSAARNSRSALVNARSTMAERAPKTLAWSSSKVAESVKDVRHIELGSTRDDTMRLLPDRFELVDERALLLTELR